MIPEIVHMIGYVGCINRLTHPYYVRQAMRGSHIKNLSFSYKEVFSSFTFIGYQLLKVNGGGPFKGPTSDFKDERA